MTRESAPKGAPTIATATATDRQKATAETPAIQGPTNRARPGRLVDIDAVGVEGLRLIAAAMDRATPSARAHAALTSEGREELAEMLAAGKRPTIKFWRRRLPPRRIREHATRGPMSTGQLVRILAEMIGNGLPEAASIEACVALAVELGLRQPIAEHAAARGVVIGRQRRRARYGW